MSPGSLDIVTGDVRIPATIRDAIRLASLLEKRYLWVDRLCIVQDGSTKQLYLDSMAAIYANACLTIAATAGTDADHGLRGIDNHSSPRCLPRLILNFEYEDWKIQMLLANPKRASVHLAPWSDRGWTLQEEAFSRRILYLGDAVYWNCGSASRSELMEEVDYPDHYEFNVAELPTWPDLERYFMLAKAFNRRKLTYDVDVIDAFAGITSVYSQQFGGDMLFGLPEHFFDFCIGWGPGGQMRRRISCTDSTSGNRLPSWS